MSFNKKRANLVKVNYKRNKTHFNSPSPMEYHIKVVAGPVGVGRNGQKKSVTRSRGLIPFTAAIKS